MISKTGVRAIRAVEALARLPEGCSVQATLLAQSLGAPPNYLAKLLRALARAGVVRSRKGPGGGFRLARDPQSIRLIDVLGPLESLGRFDGCLLDCRSGTGCPIHERWIEIRARFLALLTETTIADLAHSGRLRTPSHRIL